MRDNYWTERSRRVSRRRLLGTGGTIALGAAGLALTGCGDDDDDDVGPGNTPSGSPTTVSGSGSPKSGGTLAVGWDAPLFGLDPGSSTGWSTKRGLGYQVHEGLLGWDLSTPNQSALAVKPLLAESYETPNATTYTFKLRKGVKFHDGSDFNAEAVIYNFQRAQQSSPAYNKVVAPIVAPYHNAVDKIVSTEADSVTITLKAPFFEYLDYLTEPNTQFISPAIIEKFGAEGSIENSSGTGPWRISAFSGDTWTYERNNEYRGTKTFLDKVNFRSITDVATRTASLESGDIDLTVLVSPGLVERVEQDDRLDLAAFPEPRSFFIELGVNIAPFNDKRLRQALNFAIDRESLVKNLMKGLATPAYTPLPPGNRGHDASLKTYSYDPKNARDMLSAAGLNDVSIKMVYYAPSSALPDPPSWAAAIQSMFREIGVTLEIQGMEFNTWDEVTKGGLNSELPSTLVTWEQQNVSRGLTRLLSEAFSAPRGASNKSQYTNPEVERLLAAAQEATSEEELVAKAREAQEIIIDDAPWVYLVHSSLPRAWNKKVKGIVPLPSQMLAFENVWLDA